jgi:hypothetical protein
VSNLIKVNLVVSGMEHADGRTERQTDIQKLLIFFVYFFVCAKSAYRFKSDNSVAGAECVSPERR